MKESIILALQNLGFTLEDNQDERVIVASIHSFNNGTFEIIVHLKHQTFTVELSERFSTMYIFFSQKFKDAAAITELLLNNYAFEEFVVENDGNFEKRFRERMMIDDF